MSYKFNLMTNRTSWLTAGVVHVIDDKVFLCEDSLTDFFKQFEGMHVEIAVAPMVECGIPFDDKIKPLVDVINKHFEKAGEYVYDLEGHKRKIQTIASCEGHIGNPASHPFPWVAFNGRISWLQYGFFTPDCNGWMLDYLDRGMHIPIWRTKDKAGTAEELVKLQEKISEFVQTLAI